MVSKSLNGSDWGSTTTIGSATTYTTNISLISLDQGVNKVSNNQNGSDVNNHLKKRKSISTSAMEGVRSVSRNVFSKKQLYKKVPILDWLPKYDVQTGVSDLIAGVTVGLTVIPQGIAYALIAKLPPQYGLYSAFMGCFMYVIFGSCKDITVGPTAIMSLLTAEYASKDPAFVVLLTFVTGLIIMLLGFLRLGFVIDFISVPVTAGFTSAAAITIASGQVKSIFGLKIKHHINDSHTEGIAGTWIEVIENFDSVRVNDTILGLSCIVILLCMRALKNVNWFDSSPESPTTCQSFCMRSCNEKVRKVLATLIWVISTARNAIIVVICTFLAYGCDPKGGEGKSNRNTTFILTGFIDSDFPHNFKPPPFSFNDTSSVPNKFYAFGDMVSELGSAVIILPLLAILENVAIAKAFSGGKPVDADQEMVALGICNFMSSFVSAMPITGSFSRTAVNSASGVKTTFGCLWTGALVMLTLGLIMPYCAYIPKASLAAVIITAVIFSVEYEVIRPMWRSKKTDLIPAFATFFCCLFWALEWGILVGVGIQVLLILYHVARPGVNVDLRKLNGFIDAEAGQFLFVTLDRALIFPSVTYVRHKINKAGIREGQSKLPLVLDCSHISTADFTAANGFKAMITDFRRRNQPIIFYNTTPSVIDTFLGVNIEEFVVVHSLEELNEHLRGLMGHDEEDPSPVDSLSVSMMKNNGDSGTQTQ